MFCTSHSRALAVYRASNIWLAEAFDLYARPIKYRLNFNACEPNICGPCTWMHSRDIGARAQPGIDVLIHTRTHILTRTCLVAVSVYLPIHQLTSCNTIWNSRHDGIYEGWMRYARVKNDHRNRAACFRNIVSIISDAINRHDMSKDSGDMVKNAFARTHEFVVIENRDLTGYAAFIC